MAQASNAQMRDAEIETARVALLAVTLGLEAPTAERFEYIAEAFTRAAEHQRRLVVKQRKRGIQPGTRVRLDSSSWLGDDPWGTVEEIMGDGSFMVAPYGEKSGVLRFARDEIRAAWDRS